MYFWPGLPRIDGSRRAAPPFARHHSASTTFPSTAHHLTPLQCRPKETYLTLAGDAVGCPSHMAIPPHRTSHLPRQGLPHRPGFRCRSHVKCRSCGTDTGGGPACPPLYVMRNMPTTNSEIQVWPAAVGRREPWVVVVYASKGRLNEDAMAAHRAAAGPNPACLRACPEPVARVVSPDQNQDHIAESTASDIINPNSSNFRSSWVSYHIKSYHIVPTPIPSSHHTFNLPFPLHLKHITSYPPHPS